VKEDELITGNSVARKKIDKFFENVYYVILLYYYRRDAMH